MDFVDVTHKMSSQSPDEDINGSVPAPIPTVPNSGYFAHPADNTPPPSAEEPPYSSDLHVDDDDEDDDDQKGPHSSFEALLPVENIKHGIAVMTDLAEQAAQKMQEKAQEIVQSEGFQNAKKKTEELVLPVWEQTKATAQVAAEKTNATLHNAAEQMRPHLTVMQRQLSEASSSTWRFLSAAALQAADYTSKVASEVMNPEGHAAASAAPQEAEPGNEFNSKPMTY
eukprot:gene29448-35543_t